MEISKRVGFTFELKFLQTDHKEKEKNVRSDFEIIQYLEKHLHEEWNKEYIKMNNRSAKHPRIVLGKLKFKISLALQKRKCMRKDKVNCSLCSASRQTTKQWMY